MMAGGIVERLGVARSEVEQACGWLLRPTPESLDSCSRVLASAAAELSAGMPWLSTAHGDPEALADAWRLRRAVRRAATLLESASDFHLQWGRQLASMGDGYRPDGEPAPLVPAGRICVLG